MPVTPFLDDDVQTVRTEQEFRQARASREEQVIYFRRPRGGTHSGWILWSDSQTGKRSDMIIRGFMPITKYGHICDEDKHENGRTFLTYGAWGPILCHPDGPAEFPLEQILTYRWYSEEGLRASCNGLLPNNKQPMRLFPQLNEFVRDGGEITEYPCPECSDKNYLQALHLARHLRNAHDWDRMDILQWGTSIGVDFSREFKARRMDIQLVPVGPEEFIHEAEPTVPVKMADAPSRNMVKPCIFCSKAKIGWCKKHPPAGVA